MKTRVGDTMKVLVILGLGLGLGRWGMVEHARLVPQVISWEDGAGGFWARQQIWLFVTHDLRAMLAGVAVVAGVVTWFDRSSRRPPRVWGEGRWLLAASAAMLVLQIGNAILGEVIRRHWASLPTISADGLLGHLAKGIADGFYAQMVLGLLSGWIAIRFARWPRDPSPDLTEWFGRSILVVMILSTLVYDLFV